MTTKNFEIGQVVYILAEEAQTILPGLVVEECVVKKITGNTTSWKVKVGVGDKARLFDSAKIKGELFGSLEEVKASMTERLLTYVSNLLTEAEGRVEKWYGKEIADREKNQGSVNESPTGPDDRLDPELLLKSIEGPAVPPTPKFVKQETQSRPGESQKERLRRMAIPDDEPGPNENGAVFYVDADGVRVPVRMPTP